MKRHAILTPLKRITIVLAIFIIALFIWVQFTKPGPLGGDFSLETSNGQTVTQKDLRAKPSVVFFGYTHCPDICPTTLFDLQNWLAALGDDANKFNIWFVTVDPERDTPEVLHDYLANLSGNITGISGDPKTMNEMIQSFNIAAQKVNGDGGDYTFDHTAAVLLLNKGGRLRSIIPYQEKDAVAIGQLKALADNN